MSLLDRDGFLSAPERSTAMEAGFIDPESPCWQQCLAQARHDFYHLPQYVALCAEQEAGQPCAFFASEGPNRMLLPLILRPIESAGTAARERFDATSPYGYPSPLVWNVPLQESGDSGDATSQSQGVEDRLLEGFLSRALRKLQTELLARGVVSLFVRFHPMLSVPLEPFRWHGTLVHHGETVFLDLMLPDAEQWLQFRRAYRGQINQARQNNLIAEIDEPWDHLDDFSDIYTETMQRVQASQFYFFSKEYFLELRDALGNAIHLAIVRVGDDVAAAGLLSEVGGIVQLHLTGSRSEYAHYHASKYLVDFIRRWATQRGDRIFHLGGGLGAQNDSLLHFKAGFSKLRSVYYTWRVVVDPQAYRELVRRWQKQSSLELSGPDDFFPAYRRPLPQAVEILNAPPSP